MTAPSIAFVINSLEGGGAERVFCRVIDGVRERLPQAPMRLILLDTAEDAYRPESDIEIERLDCGGSFLSSASRFQASMRERPSALCLSFLTRANCANILAAGAAGHRAVISERVHTSSHLGNSPRGLVMKLPVRLLYPRAERTIAVSQGVRQDLIERFGVRPEKTSVIYNPVDLERIAEKGAQPAHNAPEQPYIVSVGRLQPNKNFQMVLEAFASADTGVDLAILGDGPARAELTSLAEKLGIAKRVHFLGFQANPFAILSRARAFVSGSNAEGFPNALVEAMSLGLPCAFTNCPSGPAEILAGDPAISVNEMLPADHGVLTPVNDAGQFRKAIEYIVSDEAQSRYSQAAKSRAAEFSPKTILDQYAETIERELAALKSV